MAKARSSVAATSSLRGLCGAPWRTVVLMIVALSIIGVWVNLIGHSPLFLEPIIETPHYNLGRNIYLFGRILMVSCVFFFYRFFEKGVVWICTSMCILLCVVTSLYGLNAHQTLLDALTVGLICQFLMGLSYPFIVCVFYLTIASKLRIKTAIFAIVISQVFEQIASNGLNALFGSEVLTILCIAFPLISCAAFLRARSRAHDVQYEKISGPAAKCSIILVLGAFLALAMASAISIVGFWSNVRVDYFTDDGTSAFIETLIASAAVLLLSYFTIYRRAHDPLSIRYQLPFLVVIAAFFCASIQSFFTIEFFAIDTALLSVEFFSHVFAWVVVVAAIQKLELSPLRLIAGANLFHAFICFLWELLKNSSSLFSNVALSGVCYILIVITALAAPIISGFYLRKKTSTLEDSNQLLMKGESPFAQAASGSDIIISLKSRCGAYGEYYGLTARELDVLILIAQGRSHARIEEELMLSGSTVKTHTGNIFSKMNVHSRQEIIDLVFAESEDQGR